MLPLIKFALLNISSFIFYIFSLILVYLLLKNKFIFPNSNLSFIWQFTFIISLILHQVTSTLSVFLFGDTSILYEFSFYFKVFILITPYFIRAIYYRSSFKDSFQFSSYANSSINRILNMNLTDNKYTDKRNMLLYRIIFTPLIILLLLLILLLLIPKTNTILQNMIILYDNSQESKGELLDILIISSTGMILHSIIVLILIFFIFNLYSFPIKNDYLLIKFEISLISCIWIIDSYINIYSRLSNLSEYISYNIFEYVNINNAQNNKQEIYIFTYMLNSFTNLSYIVIFIYILFKRGLVSEKPFFEIISNFELFIKTQIGFDYLKSHFLNSASSETNEKYKFLFFWNEASCLKRQYVSNYHSYYKYFNGGDYLKEEQISVIDENDDKVFKNFCKLKENNMKEKIKLIFIDDYLKGNKLYDLFVNKKNQKNLWNLIRPVLSNYVTSNLMNSKIKNSGLYRISNIKPSNNTDDFKSQFIDTTNNEDERETNIVIKLKNDNNNNEENGEIKGKIYLPVDIIERLKEYFENEKMLNGRFILNMQTIDSLLSVFDDSIQYCYHRLYDEYINMMRKEEYRMEFVSLFKYIDFIDYRD